MDPIQSIQIHLDSTFAVMIAAQERNHDVFYALAGDLRLENGVPFATARKLFLRNEQGNHADEGPEVTLPLRECDAVFMRKDPPFNMEYIFATYILEAAEPAALIVNQANSLRDHNEKLYSLQFPEFCPESIVAASSTAILEFQAQLNSPIVVKPLDGNGGEGIFVMAIDDPNRNVILETSTCHGTRPVIAQRYLPEAPQGDKRILIIDGEFHGAVLRVPGTTDHRGNIHVGATCHKTNLTEREQAMVKALGPRLYADGHIFVGIDVIGDYLTEINVTSPTGIHEINAFDDRRVDVAIIEAVEKRLAKNNTD